MRYYGFDPRREATVDTGSSGIRERESSRYLLVRKNQI
jgi:hypothetical protein